MKTDRVLTMFEFRDQWGVVPIHVTLPAADARHVPITVQGDADVRNENHCRRCDRWRHPCKDCKDSQEEIRAEDAAIPNRK